MDKDVRIAMATEEAPQYLDSLARGCTVHDVNLWPLRMSIYSHHEHVTVKWPSKVNVNSFPWISGPYLGVERCKAWSFLYPLAVVAGLD